MTTTARSRGGSPILERSRSHDVPAAPTGIDGASVDEVMHYGSVLRVTTRGGADPEALVREVLTGALAPRAVRPVRVGVEDAFVSMVRADERAAQAAT